MKAPTSHNGKSGVPEARRPLGAINMVPSSNRRHGEGPVVMVEAFIAGVTTAAALFAILLLVREVLA